MIIKSSTKNYEVTIHQNLEFFDSLVGGNRQCMYVIDQNVYRLYYDQLFSKCSPDEIFLVEAIETNKVIDTALAICERMTAIPAKRNAHLISIGGGIIQDITGFAANILYRGIHWTFVPTTLLAACDSCIGGKTSLNYKSFKNLLGTFYPPDSIHICPLFFHTLSGHDFESGLGEVVKFNLMYGEAGLLRMEKDICRLCSRDETTLNKYVETSLLFKKDFIEEDEFDRGIRIHLNFAHTFGHAFESMSNYAIPHGTAVAIGMLVANRISLDRLWLTPDFVTRMEAVLLQIIHVDIQSIPLDFTKIIMAIRKDKKQTNTDLTAVLMYDEMKLKVIHDLKPEEVENAVSYVFQKLEQQ